MFDVITGGKPPKETHLIINVTAAREAYQPYDIDSVGLVREENNATNVLSKICTMVHSLVLYCRIKHMTQVKEWIVRTDDSRHKNM